MPQSRILTYRDWYRDGPFASVPQADRIVAAGPVHIINVSPPGGAVVEPPIPEFALHLLLRSAPLLRVGFNRHPRWLAVSPGSMVLAPPDTTCEFVADEAAHVLTVAIPKAQAEEFARDRGVRIDVRQEEAFRDPRLAHQIVRLWHELADERLGAGLLGDQVMRTILAAIARRTGSGRRSGSGDGGDGRDGGSTAGRGESHAGRERLANHTLRRLRDYVESSLAEELDVMVMASVAGLSPAHFARAFAATVGMTPFRYVMTRRLARARELLERTRRPALDIALDVGFKTPSHFASRFRQEFGISPRAVRTRADGDADAWARTVAAIAAADHATGTGTRTGTGTGAGIEAGTATAEAGAQPAR